jgi:thioredoxin
MNLTEFQHKITQSEKPIVVDFWATWCMPCKITKPIIERLAKRYAEQVEFLAVDADASQDLVAHYGVYGIPTVLAYRDGEELARVSGAQNKATYQGIFDSLANGGELKVSISRFDRVLRISAGVVLGLLGISSANWLLLDLAGVIAFWGVYDRCPVWAALTKRFRGK